MEVGRVRLLATLNLQLGHRVWWALALSSLCLIIQPRPPAMESCLLQFGWIFLPQLTQSRKSLTDTIRGLSPESRFCHRVIAFESCTSVTLPVPRCPRSAITGSLNGHRMPPGSRLCTFKGWIV